MGAKHSNLIEKIDLRTTKKTCTTTAENIVNVKTSQSNMSSIEVEMSNVYACSCDLKTSATVNNKIKRNVSVESSVIADIPEQIKDDIKASLKASDKFKEALRDIGVTEENYNKNLDKINKFIDEQTQSEAFKSEVTSEYVTNTQNVADVNVSQHVSSISKLKVDEIIFDPCGYTYFLPEGKCTRDIILEGYDKYVPPEIMEYCKQGGESFDYCNVDVSLTSENVVDITIKQLINIAKEHEFNFAEPDEEEDEEEDEEDDSSQKGEKNNNSFSSGEIAFIVIACLIFAGAFIYVVFFRKKPPQPIENQFTPIFLK